MTNVVLIHTDDTGRRVGPYGHAVETPALEDLADRGVLFRNAHSACPTCSPSRGALMTGQSPHANGLVGLAHLGFEVDDYDHHLASVLDCETVLAGQQHECDREGLTRHEAAREVVGYDRVLSGDPEAAPDFDLGADHERTRDDLANAAAVASYLGSAPEDFFLSFGLWNTHKPFPTDQTLVDPDRVAVPPFLPDTPAVREEVAGYHALARAVDRCVETVVTALREADLLSETAVIFTTDHGLPLPGAKCNLTDAGTGVALIARFPDGPRGTVEDALVSTMDLFPTVCELRGRAVPDRVEGESLWPLLEGAERVRDAVYGEITYHAAYEPVRSVRTERYRYVRRFDATEPYRGRVGPNTDPGAARAHLAERGYFAEQPPDEALYDLSADPGERANLAGDPAHEAVRADLESRLRAWMERTGDPLLAGPVSKPSGARAHRRDADSHSEQAFEPADAR